MERIKVMVVEDDSQVAFTLKRVLTHIGHTIVACVDTGEEAVGVALERKPDIILMDIKLAGEMDGIEAARAIHERTDIPIIYLTAYSDRETLDRAKLTVPFGYLLKPFKREELKSGIQMAVYRHGIEQKLRENEQWLSTTLRSIGEGVISTDCSGSVKSMNPMAEKLTGWTAEEALGKTLADVCRLLQGQVQTSPPVDDVILDGKTLRSANVTVLSRARGGRTPVDFSISPIKDQYGSTVGAVIVLSDITERLRFLREQQESINNLQVVLQETANALSATLEKRDPYTAGHQKRVAQLACAIGRELGLPAQDIEVIYISGLLHDIGKVYVPAEILSKPAALDSIEMSMIRCHPQVGYDILKAIPFDGPVADIVLQHHEKLDGSGYPLGLTGDQILPAAKVLTVADVVEAMSSHRPYRPALGTETALKEVIEHKGTAYGPDAVDACVSLFERGRFEFQ